MNIERDKFYRTRDGDKIRVVCIDAPDPFPVIGIRGNKSICHFTKEGEFLLGKRGHYSSLIALWVDKPEADWSVLPPWVNYVVKGKDGQWRAYMIEPKLTQLGWWYNGEFPIVIPPAYAPKWTGDWKDSMVTREVGK